VLEQLTRKRSDDKRKLGMDSVCVTLSREQIQVSIMMTRQICMCKLMQTKHGKREINSAAAIASPWIFLFFFSCYVVCNVWICTCMCFSVTYLWGF